MAEGWYVRNAREGQWWDRGPRGAVTSLVEDDDDQVGVNLFVLGPGQPLRQWDFVHTPANVAHTIVGAGSRPAAILAIGAREHQGGEAWGGYPYSELAMQYDASAEEETNDPRRAYARFPARQPSPYREEWLG